MVKRTLGRVWLPGQEDWATVVDSCDETLMVRMAKSGRLFVVARKDTRAEAA